MSRRPFPWLLFLLALVPAGTGAQPAFEAAPLRLREPAVPPRDPGLARFEAGFELTSGDPGFGGLSGLWLDEDGTRLVLASDRGALFEARLEHDLSGRLNGVFGLRRVDLPPDGLTPDAEALAGTGDTGGTGGTGGTGSTGLVIAFENDHRLRAIDARTLAPAPSGPAFDLPSLGEPGNQGLEALAALGDGRLLALSEGRPAGPGRSLGWILDDGPPVPLFHATTGSFVPTGADRDGERIYVLERRFSFAGGFGTRIVAIDAGMVGPGAVLDGDEILRLELPLPAENYEGLAARATADGRTLLYVVSDDNFNLLQRTLLLQFSLRPPD